MTEHFKTAPPDPLVGLASPVHPSSNSPPKMQLRASRLTVPPQEAPAPETERVASIKVHSVPMHSVLAPLRIVRPVVPVAITERVVREDWVAWADLGGWVDSAAGLAATTRGPTKRKTRSGQPLNQTLNTAHEHPKVSPPGLRLDSPRFRFPPAFEEPRLLSKATR